jgi:hypothetical protein
VVDTAVPGTVVPSTGAPGPDDPASLAAGATVPVGGRSLVVLCGPSD